MEVDQIQKVWALVLMIALQEVLMDRICKARVSVKTAWLPIKITTMGKSLELETLV